MLRLYACIVTQHDLRLVAIAAAICLLSCYTAVDLLSRARQSPVGRRASWAWAAATIFGAGVWATHFLAELAYDPGLPLGYEIRLTALSLVAAVALSWLGIAAALYGETPLMGGGLIGLAVGVMHYTGMAALRLPAAIRWDAGEVLASLAVGIAFGAAALRLLWPVQPFRRRALGAGLLVASICGLHFIGMSAITLTPDPRIEVVGAIVRSGPLIAAVAAVTTAIAAVALIGLAADAGLARRAEREAARLRRSEARMTDAIEAFPEGFVLYDEAGGFVLCNERFRSLHAGLADLLHPGARFEDLVRQAAERRLFAFGSGGAEAWIEDRLERWRSPGPAFEQRLATGEWLRVTNRRTSDGGTIGVHVDISELKQREAGFRLLFESNPLPMMVHDARTSRFLEVNQAAVAHYGYSREQFLAMTVEQLHPPQEVPEALQAGMQPGLTCHRKADGSVMLAEITGHRLSFHGRSATLMVASDVTERRRSEAALNHSQRLEALGTLAGGVAHDLNNTLVPVLALAKVTMKRLPEDSREHAHLATILKAGERARELVRQILAFSRKEEPSRQTVDLAALLREALEILRASLPATIRLEAAIAEVPPISADPGQLHQVLLNLAVNAAQAIGERGGRITVTLRPARHALPAGAQGDAVVPAVHIAVEDTGCGMDEATRQRVFEPFFTTKPVGDGTGLGLSVAHGIIARHGGIITVESRAGHGTRFDVYLPALAGGEAGRPLETAVPAM